MYQVNAAITMSHMNDYTAVYIPVSQLRFESQLLLSSPIRHMTFTESSNHTNSEQHQLTEHKTTDTMSQQHSPCGCRATFVDAHCGNCDYYMGPLETQQSYCQYARDR